MKWFLILLIVALSLVLLSSPLRDTKGSPTLTNAEAKNLIVEVSEAFGVEPPVVGYGYPDLCAGTETGCVGGFYIPWQHTIALGDNPRLSTVTHELAHAIITKLDPSHDHDHDQHFNAILTVIQLGNEPNT